MLMFVLLSVFWMSDGRFSLGNWEKQQLCPPTAEAPVGLQKRMRRKCLLISRISGDREKKYV